MAKNLILLNMLFPIFGILLLLIISKKEEKLLKQISLVVSFFSFFFSLLLWGALQKKKARFQFVYQTFWFSFFNINFTLGVDGISILFLNLTTLLIPLCLLVSWNSVKINLKEFLIAFLFLNFLLIGTFCSLDLLFFYIFFESILIPMYLIVGIWGSRERKILAAYYFFIYTLFGSAFMLASILYIYWQVGTTDYELLLTFSFSKLEQNLIWLSFFLAFASKIPMLPFHLWLPEAHVEAPTAGSILLAGILLKLGTYGFIRFSLPLFPIASIYYTPLVDTLAVLSIVFTSFTAIRQTDLKRIIAYTSIAHMNLVMLGIFSFNVIGIEGAILQSLSHGFVASSLFLVIGVVYDRYKTRLVKYYGGLATLMPIYTIIFLFFTISNMAFPGTSSFVGEFLLLTGSFQATSKITVVAAISVIVSSVYSLWLLNRIAYGNTKIQYIKIFSDVNLREFLTFLPLIVGTIVVGIYPKFFLNTIHKNVNLIIELLHI